MNIHDVCWDAWQASRPLGSGRSGEVFEIQHSGPKGLECAALKVMHIPGTPEVTSKLLAQGQSPEMIKDRYHKRMETAMIAYGHMWAMGNHPNVLNCDQPVCDAMGDGYGWEIKLKMALSRPLGELWPQGMPEQQVLQLGTDLATALALCQEQGLVHEGIKQSNIFVSATGNYQLGDFGAAKVSGMPCGGDRSCMAPEMYWGMPYDGRADVYSLGILLYTMLNGGYQPLTWPGMTEEEKTAAIERRLSGDTLAPPCSGSPALQRLVLRACAYEPANRFASALEFREAFLQLRGMSPDTALWPAQMGPKQHLAPAAEETVIVQEELEQPQPTEIQSETPPRKKKSFLFLILALVGALLVVAVVCFFTIHVWPEVGCNEIAKCKICGKTATQVQEHAWQEATCLKPETCRICGDTKGEPMGHQLTQPTRDTPATCTVCGAAEGDVLKPTLWVLKVISNGWQGGHNQEVADGDLLLSFRNDAGFTGSEMTVTDANGRTLSNVFVLQWQDNTAKVTPEKSLEPGVYHVRFSAGDAGALVYLCYGYEGDFYLQNPEHFWSGNTWRNYQSQKYLMVEDGRVTGGDIVGMATVFESPLDMVGAERTSDGRLKPTAEDPVAITCMSYIRDGHEEYAVFCYENHYLACDEDGNIYFSAELDEQCFWVSG